MKCNNITTKQILMWIFIIIIVWIIMGFVNTYWLLHILISFLVFFGLIYVEQIILIRRAMGRKILKRKQTLNIRNSIWNDENE